MNPSVLFPEALKEVIRSAAGSCCIPFNQLQGGQAVGDRAPRLRACLIYLLFIRVRNQLHVPSLVFPSTIT
jgi:hypothetical protein